MPVKQARESLDRQHLQLPLIQNSGAPHSMGTNMWLWHRDGGPISPRSTADFGILVWALRHFW